MKYNDKKGFLSSGKPVITLASNERKILLLLFLLALIIRTIYVYKTFQKEGDANWNDAKLYVYYGNEFAKGNFYPVIPGINLKLIVPPVIPLVFAFFQLIIPDNYWPFFIYNILLTSILVILLFHIGKMLWNRSLGYIMAIWGLLFFDYIKYDPTVLKEPTICFLIILLVYLVVKYLKNGKHLRCLLGIGISFTLLIHTDERYIALFPLVLLIPFLEETRLRLNKVMVTQTSLLTATILILMIPWTIRNYIEYNEIVILSPRTTALTSKVWGTNLSSINFEGDSRAYNLMERRIEKAQKISDQYGIEPRLQTGTESRIMAFINFWQPTYFRPAFIQYGYRFQKWSFMHNMTSIMFYGIFLPFYFIGIIRFIRKRRVFLIWLACIPLINSLIHAIMVWPLERYRMPVNFIIVLIGMLYLFEYLEDKYEFSQRKHNFLSQNSKIQT